MANNYRQHESAKPSKLLSAEAAKERRKVFFQKLQPKDTQVDADHAPPQESTELALPEEPLLLKLADEKLRVERLASILQKNNTEIIKYSGISASLVEVWKDILTRYRLSKLAFSGESWFAPELKEAVAKLSVQESMNIFYTDKKTRDQESENGLSKDKGAFMHTTEGKLAFAEYDVGITTAAAGIALTGSLLLVPTLDEPRSLSLVPPVHIVVLRKEDVVANFYEWIIAHKEVVERDHFVLISGPSKTADIEKRLVYGVHGPKQLIVLLYE